MKKQHIITLGLLMVTLIPAAYWLLHNARTPANNSYHAVPAITQFMGADLTSTNSTMIMTPGSQDIMHTNPITTSDCSYPVGIGTNWSSRSRSH